MAEFGANVTEAPQVGVASTVKAPVERSNAGLAGALTIFDQAVKAGETIIGNRQEQVGNKALADFTNQQLKIIEGARQGKIKNRMAQTMLTNNLMQAVASSPGLRKDFLSIQKDVTGGAGMGSFLDEKSQEEKDMEYARQQGLAGGYILPGASDEQVLSAFEERQRAEQTSRMYAQRAQEIKARMDDLGLQGAEREEAQEQLRYNAEEGLLATHATALDEYEAGVQKVMESDAPTEEKLATLDRMKMDLEAGVSGAMMNIDSTRADAYMKSFNSLDTYARRMIKGEISQEAWDAQKADGRRVIERRLLANEQIANAYVASELLGESLSSLTNTMAATEVSKIIMDNSGKGGNPFDLSKQGIRGYGDILKKEPETDTSAAEQVEQIDGFLRGMTRHQVDLEDDASVGVEAVRILADPKMFDKIQANADNLPSLPKARETLSLHFETEVWSMVQREFKNANVISGLQRNSLGGVAGMDQEGSVQVQPTPEAVGYRAVATGVEFYPINGSNTAAVTEAKRLNKVLRPIINESVRAFSHLEGHQNYQQFFEKAAERYLGAGSDDPDTDAVDKLTPEMMKEDLGNISGAAVGRQLMSDLQSDLGLSLNQAAGIVGNLHHESAGFNVLQEIKPLVEGSRGGFGYAQWTGPRRRAFEAWANEKGLDKNSYEANYGFLIHELTNTREGGVLGVLKNAKSASEAVRIFQNYFLRPGIPHTQSRINAAEGYKTG